MIVPPPILSTWVLACIAHFDDGLVVLGPKCHESDCAEPAVAVVHWPSGPIRCCSVHAARWAAIGDRGLGMHLAIEPLHYTRGGLDDAELRFAAMELT